MSIIFKAALVVFAFSSISIAQDPMPVLGSSWRLTTQKASKTEPPSNAPARGMTEDDKYFQRKAREQRTDNPPDPSEMSVDGRSAQLQKLAQQSETPQAEDVRGFSYAASVRNDSAKTVKVIYWEYRFTNLAHPTSIVRRQFLCAVDLKKGGKMDLTAFSTLGPSDVISADSLSRTTDKLFDEKVQINRIEFGDDTVLQRNGWKFDEVKTAVDRITSSPWGKEVCRVL